ncbi:actin [Operophtera brumata]|uniref:Actin n=1 Tax=Operophtera brumata TaxID=104452 RepID=A0A0L7L7V8_OPEBR|nr:actin [Operophtera brumata]
MSGQEISVVFDTGSQTTKVGFAGEAFPRAVFPTVVARFRRAGLVDGFPLIYCGKEAIQNRGLSHLTWPVEEGQIQDWDEMEKFWHHAFYKEIHVPPEDSKVLHAVHPLVSRRDRERMAEVLFESFAISGLYLMKSPALVLHASGRTTGVALETGYSCCYAAPVFEGFPLKQSTEVSPLNGELLTNRLQKLMVEIGYSFTTPEERCYVAHNYEEEIANSTCSGENKTSYKLPDGQQIILGEERFKCPEVLFNPSLEGLNCQSVVDIICSSISKSELENRALFYQNIVVAGGNSMIPGLVNRLKAELGFKLVKEPWKTNVDALPSRRYAAWVGGSILASLSCLKGFWMTKEEYEDVGSDRVNYKFF